jgi:hypothetical protein
MKDLKEFINESKPSFNVKSDIYKVLSDLAFEYDKKGKDFTKKDAEQAFEWFLMEFFED